MQECHRSLAARRAAPHRCACAVAGTTASDGICSLRVLGLTASSALFILLMRQPQEEVRPRLHPAAVPAALPGPAACGADAAGRAHAQLPAEGSPHTGRSSAVVSRDSVLPLLGVRCESCELRVVYS